MSDHSFRTQHLTHSILGYSQNPSNDPNAPRFVGSITAAEANNFSTIDGVRQPKAAKRELKRKRKVKGSLDVVEGDGAYVGPWAEWAGDKGEDIEIPEEEEPDAEDIEDAQQQEERRRIAKGKRSMFGAETSTFHGKALTDYQGRTYMSPPLGVAPHLTTEPGEQECFIPKACVHTFTGHTLGVSVIRLLPKTGHLMLSGSMDTKIKVRICFLSYNLSNFTPSVTAVGCISRGELPAYIHGSPQSRQRCHILKRWSQVP